MKEGGPIDLEYYADIYFGGKKPENITIYFLRQNEYKKKYQELSKKIFGASDNEYKDTLGYYIYDKKDDSYHVLIRDCGIGFENVYIMNLYHELSHVITIPKRTGASLYCSSSKKDSDAVIGYQFWVEYIAHYEAINRYLMTIGDIEFLKDRDTVKRKLTKLMPQYDEFLYEIVLYSEMTDVYIDGTEDETKSLIQILRLVKNRFVSKDDICSISKKELKDIGKSVWKLFSKIRDL